MAEIMEPIVPAAVAAPIVMLQEVTVISGEENEDVLLEMNAKLYRFDNEGKQWKERGSGTVKLLKHKQTGIVRVLMRQSKTLKIRVNHIVSPSICLQEHARNEKSCVWHAFDFSDEELNEETFCIRFASVESVLHLTFLRNLVCFCYFKLQKH